MPCSIHCKSPIKPPQGAYLFQAHLRGGGGGGLIETWGLLRGTVSLHFLSRVNNIDFFPKGDK